MPRTKMIAKRPVLRRGCPGVQESLHEAAMFTVEVMCYDIRIPDHEMRVKSCSSLDVKSLASTR